VQKTAEPIQMPFGLMWAKGSMYYVRVHIGTICQIQLNRPCAVMMQPVVKLP